MSAPLLAPSLFRKNPGWRRAAFTLVELLIVIAIFLLIIEGVVYTHLFGCQLYVLSQSKMGASDSSRTAISRMVDDIRSCTQVHVGTGGLSFFSFDASGANQTGSALQLYPTTNTNYYVRYYWDPADSNLKRTTNGTSETTIVIQAITNWMIFDQEDAFGNILTTNCNISTVGVKMQFYQLVFPQTPIAPGQLYDYYQLSTKATPRLMGMYNVF
jgi:prepilin-type N-terminal cleavage/methylation domain-containing protein